MSRLPPALLYLTIYNPDLKPSAPVEDDDEDAEEQAHILFYTARERAVSRDRMLRQIGLAKALINFADMLAPEDVCENVHSQSRRMLMISPEPGFWMHACVELAKSPRQPATSKAKGKQKSKEKDKDKDKGKEPDTEAGYDYYDGSVHDEALRSQLLRGYEQFKLLHGSFTSILRNIGQQALELQLERFFTVWAWRWDIEQDSDFGSHLGIPLHPLHKSILPLLDEFASHIPLPNEAVPFVLSPPHVILSTSYATSRVPSSLPLFLRTRIPPPRPPSFTKPTPNDQAVPVVSEEIQGPTSTGFANGMNVTKDAMEATGSAFVAIGASMDVRKWSWPGYLTFGKAGRKPGSIIPPEDTESSGEGDVVKETTSGVNGEEGEPNPEGHRFDGELHVRIDTESLHDAISSVGVVAPAQSSPDMEGGSSAGDSPPHEETMSDPPTSLVEVQDGDVADVVSSDEELSAIDAPTPLADDSEQPPVATTSEFQDGSPIPFNSSLDLNSLPSPSSSQHTVPAPPLPLPTFSTYPVFLAPHDRAQETVRRKVLYLIHDQLAVAFLAPQASEYSDEELATLHQISSALLGDVQNLVAEDQASKSMELYSATKILQPKDKHIIATGKGTTVSSPGFASRSEHLYNAQQLITSTDAIEVFSRTQGPQHWHIARREQVGAVYMEVSRKETSLADVDNELAGVVRRFQEEV